MFCVKMVSKLGAMTVTYSNKVKALYFISKRNIQFNSILFTNICHLLKPSHHLLKPSHHLHTPNHHFHTPSSQLHTPSRQFHTPFHHLHQCCGSASIIMQIRIQIQDPKNVQMDPDPDPRGKGLKKKNCTKTIQLNLSK